MTTEMDMEDRQVYPNKEISREKKIPKKNSSTLQDLRFLLRNCKFTKSNGNENGLEETIRECVTSLVATVEADQLKTETEVRGDVILAPPADSDGEMVSETITNSPVKPAKVCCKNESEPKPNVPLAFAPLRLSSVAMALMRSSENRSPFQLKPSPKSLSELRDKNVCKISKRRKKKKKKAKRKLVNLEEFMERGRLRKCWVVLSRCDHLLKG